MRNSLLGGSKNLSNSRSIYMHDQWLPLKFPTRGSREEPTKRGNESSSRRMSPRRDLRMQQGFCSLGRAVISRHFDCPPHIRTLLGSVPPGLQVMSIADRVEPAQRTETSKIAVR